MSVKVAMIARQITALKPNERTLLNEIVGVFDGNTADEIIPRTMAVKATATHSGRGNRTRTQLVEQLKTVYAVGVVFPISEAIRKIHDLDGSTFGSIRQAIYKNKIGLVRVGEGQYKIAG